MNRFLPRAPGLAAGLALLMLPAVSHAAYTQYVGAYGTSTGAGGSTIIIESFGELLATGAMAAPVHTINSSIAPGSTASSTALLLRNDIDAEMPTSYVVTMYSPNIVRITNNVGTFTISVQENVPGQAIRLVNPLPGFDGAGSIALALALALSGGVMALRRSRSA